MFVVIFIKFSIEVAGTSTISFFQYRPFTINFFYIMGFIIGLFLLVASNYYYSLFYLMGFSTRLFYYWLFITGFPTI